MHKKYHGSDEILLHNTFFFDGNTLRQSNWIMRKWLFKQKTRINHLNLHRIQEYHKVHYLWVDILYIKLIYLADVAYIIKPGYIIPIKKFVCNFSSKSSNPPFGKLLMNYEYFILQINSIKINLKIHRQNSWK